MKPYGSTTIYFLQGDTKKDVRDIALAKDNLTLSQLLRILAKKYLNNEIELTESDKKYI